MDNFTIILMMMLVSGLMSLALTALYSTSKNEPAIRDWIAAMLCFFTSSLIGSVHNQVDFPFYIFPGMTNTLYLTGHALIFSGIRRYCINKSAYGLVVAIFLLALLSVFSDALAQSYVKRLLVYYPPIIALCCMSILTIHRQQRHSSLTGYMPVLWVSGLFALQLFLRTVSIVLGEFGVKVPLLTYITQHGAILVLLYIIAISMGFAYLISWQKEEALRKFSVTDNLTQWLNRHALSKEAPRLFAQARNNAAPVSIVIMDIDHFKLINDQYGHATGDQVLVHISQLVRSMTPQAQIHVRLGGEEFMWLLSNYTSQQALILAEQVCRTIHQTPFPGPPQLMLSASFGVADCKAADISWQTVLKRADKALYAAKNHGRNQCMTYQPDLSTAKPAASCQLA